MDDVQEDVADGRVLALVEAFLKDGVMEDGELREPKSGTPQGGVISPLLANIYLHPVDVVLHQAGYESVRYADDSAPRRRDEEVVM